MNEWMKKHKRIMLCVACVVVISVIAVAIFFINRDKSKESAESEELTVEDNSSVEETEEVEEKAENETEAIVKDEDSQSDEEAVEEESQDDNAYIEDFPIILQNPGMPSGCEVTSLTMVLNYLGYGCTNYELADNYLPYGQVGDNMFEKMIGSVYDDYALGCYAGAIVTCARNYGGGYTVENVSGSDLDTLCGYVREGHPVIVWATENMNASYPDVMWEYNGQTMGYKKWEHCLVMIGYDRENDTVTMADPMRGEVKYSLSTFYTRYNEIYSQAVLIY